MQQETTMEEPTMEEAEKERKQIQNMWEYISACQFLWMFSYALGIDEFNIRELESSLLSNEINDVLLDIFIKLLSSLYKSRSVSVESWYSVLILQFEKRQKTLLKWKELLEWAGIQDSSTSLDEIMSIAPQLLPSPATTTATLAPEEEQPIDGKAILGKLNVKYKVLILYALCEWQLENIDGFRALVDDKVSVSWVSFLALLSPNLSTLKRIAPIGKDAHGNTYYHFDGHRLYRQKNNTKHSKEEEWECLCDSLVEWENFVSCFEPKTRVERDLKSALDSVLPIVTVDLEEMEMQERKKQERIQAELKKQASRFRIKELQQLKIQSLGFDSVRSSRRLASMTANKLLLSSSLDTATTTTSATFNNTMTRTTSTREQRARDRALGISKSERIQLQDLENSLTTSITSTTRSASNKKSKTSNFFSCICGQEESELVGLGLILTCNECQMEQHAKCVYEARGIMDLDLYEWSTKEFTCDVCLEYVIQEEQDSSKEEEGEEFTLQPQELEQEEELDMEMDQEMEEEQESVSKQQQEDAPTNITLKISAWPPKISTFYNEIP